MTKAVEIKGTIYHIKDDEYDKFCNDLKDLNVPFKKVDDWSVKNYEKVKHYTPETLIEAANFYFNQKPSDIIQAAEKLWLAAVFAVKKLFLCLEVHVVSHSALKFCCKFALDECSLNKKASTSALNGWIAAESLHSFSYGSHMKQHTFIKKKIEIEQFVTNFLTIDPTEIKSQLNDLIVNLSLDINIEKKEGNVMLGGKFYKYNYCFY